MTLDERYSSNFRELVQYLLVKRIIPYNRIREFLVNPDDIEDNSLNISDVLNIINDTISSFNHRLVISYCEVTGNKLCILTSRSWNDQMKKFPMFTQQEETFFYALVKEIIGSPSGCIGSNDAVNLSQDLEKGMSVSQSMSFLERLISNNYIISSREGLYYLSSLTITDLSDIIAKCPDVKNCYLCDKLVINSHTCKNCGSYFHLHCYRNLESDSNELNCPSCNKCLPVI